MHLVHLLLFCYTHILLHFAAGACLRFVIYHRASEICPVNRCIVTLTNYVFLSSLIGVAPLCKTTYPAGTFFILSVIVETLEDGWYVVKA